MSENCGPESGEDSGRWLNKDEESESTALRFADHFLREDDFFVLVFFAADFFFGTFAPALRASERPMAMACLRLVTFFPLRPLFSVPRFCSRITFSTFLPAPELYFLAEDFFFVAMNFLPSIVLGSSRG